MGSAVDWVTFVPLIVGFGRNVPFRGASARNA